MMQETWGSVGGSLHLAGEFDFRTGASSSTEEVGWK